MTTIKIDAGVLERIGEILLASSDSHAAVEPILPTEKLVAHSKWMREQISIAVNGISTAQPQPEVTVEEIAGDMVNALYDYKILGGRFGDTSARVIISMLESKYPQFRIVRGEREKNGQ